MSMRDWFKRNYADTDEPTHADVRPVDLPLPPDIALARIRHALESRPRWAVVTVDGKPVEVASPSRWPWVRGKEAVWSRLTPSHVEEVIRTGPTWPNVGWLTATHRTWMMRFIDDVLVWLEGRPGGCRVHARSRSRMGRGDLGQNRRNLLDLFEAIDPLRRTE